MNHISKSATYEPRLSVHSAKGNSVIEQKADKVIGIMGDRDTNKRILRSLKSRDEARFQIALNFEYETMRFKEMKNAEV